jgi:hypothetical protein
MKQMKFKHEKEHVFYMKNNHLKCGMEIAYLNKCKTSKYLLYHVCHAIA